MIASAARSPRRWLFAAALVAAVVLAVFPVDVPAASETDLDLLMGQVLGHRDDNWKKLQQYILDEHETLDLRGPGRQPIWGEDREYTWFIRDGFFVRSPIKINGVTIGDADRRKAEAEYLERQKRRDERQREREADAGAATAPASPLPGGDSVDGILRQIRQPGFISSAYFLRFRFERGKYALVGRERIDNRDLLRVEYYPSNLYSDDQRRRQATSHDKKDPYDAELQRMMNKVALVTLWIEPAAQQIVKYTFDNVDFDFLPGRWLARLDSARASMTMAQPFPDVWLPQTVEFSGAATTAAGAIDLRYVVEYHDYRQADVKTKLRVPGER